MGKKPIIKNSRNSGTFILTLLFRPLALIRLNNELCSSFLTTAYDKALAQAMARAPGPIWQLTLRDKGSIWILPVLGNMA